MDSQIRDSAIEEAALFLESEARKTADVIADWHHRVYFHPFRTRHNDCRKRWLSDLAEREKKFRLAASTIRTLKTNDQAHRT